MAGSATTAAASACCWWASRVSRSCSALVGFAPTPGVLVAGRILQGLAGGLVNPQVSGVVQQLFPLHERGRAFGWIGTAVGIATAAGPVVGGLIIALGGPVYGWRLCFLVNVPIGITSFLLCRAWLPSPPPRSGRVRRLDLPGAALLAVGVFGVLFPLVQYDATRDPRLALLLASRPRGARLFRRLGTRPRPTARPPAHRRRALPGALLRRRRHPRPALLLRLHRDAAGAGAVPAGRARLLGAALGADGVGVRGRRDGGGARGRPAAPPPRSARPRRRPRPLRRRGRGRGSGRVRTSGSVPPAAVGLLLAAPLLLAGLGGGSVITPNQALSLAEVDVRGGSTAGGTLQTSQRIGNAVGAAVISAVFYAAVAGAPAAGPSREAHYGRAYALALVVSVLFAVAAWLVALRSDRRASGGNLKRRAAGAPG